MSAEVILARIHGLTHDLERVKQLYKEKTEAVSIERQEEDKLEKEKIRLQHHLKVLLNKSDEAEKEFVEVERKLHETEVMAAESERMKHALQQRTNDTESALESLEARLAEAQKHTLQAEKKYADIAAELTAREEIVSQSEKQAESFERQLADLEKEVQIAANKLRIKKARNEKDASKDDEYKKQVNEMMSKIKDALEKADSFERKSLKHQKELSIRADELSFYIVKRDALRRDMDNMLVDVQDA